MNLTNTIFFLCHIMRLISTTTLLYTLYANSKSVVPFYNSYNGKYCELLVLVEAAARLVLFLERRELALLRLLLLNL